ncbi:MAG: hypothetical protein PHE27_02320 [Alphaproteobacteria bacterium]|nr:hypothetical protein [Alphaproteobacteria bacterium]
MTDSPNRFSSSAGIAIGPILFVLAMLALLGSIFATGGNDFQTASVSDRINADIASQANMIRNTINNCNLQFVMALSMGSVPDANINSDPYPASDAEGTAVRDLECTPLGTAKLWGASDGSNGSSGVLFPPPTKGFTDWYYVNGGENGRCIWTSPTVTSSAIVAGLSRAAGKFNYSETVTLTNEAVYNPASTGQKFIVWITVPADLGSVDSHCQPGS